VRRNVVAATAAALSLAVLWGCSAIPTKSISAAQLQGLVLAGDLGLDPSFDTTFTTQPIALRNSTIESFWSESEGTPEECYPAYAASYLAGESSGDSDELADIAGFYPDAGGAINVFGRSFDSEGAASSFLDGLTDVAAECTDAGGYQLSDGAGGLGWDATAVSIESAADLSLPGGVTAAYQVEAVDAQYAALYRVTYLQFENVVVAVMAQQLEASVFTADQLDELAESVAERLARL
jgi:hypothetical protein